LATNEPRPFAFGDLHQARELVSAAIAGETVLIAEGTIEA